MNITLLEQRLVEANIFRAMYATLSETLGQQAALGAVIQAAKSLAAQAGRAFAACAPPEDGGPGFEHFKTVLELWSGTGALTIENVRADGKELSFEVTRCTYVEKYREMGLPEELVATISCCRDEPFAKAYSGHISMARSDTIGEGADRCRFRFTWRD
ncbi:L-2-amino-thiazoline-4-carboxylic acid hydrolase [Fundidesulfovibrio terrae]|uniref:L-2-amino-thiazoline-4-carboxylic acid hydrolase n=1 Tax=Fundidesulfovibrio terrae TaxID=2922866 RepID=UPI001FAEF06E|nr:L-2-amino-thiazoline-4-carboxylic acid hydrolase [Fundidesulfovibrio terrae]